MKRLPIILLLAFACLPLHPPTFTNAQDARIEGEILKMQGAQVTLKLADGRIVTFEIALLSKADQEHVRAWKPDSQVEGGVYLAVGNGLQRLRPGGD